MGIFVLKMAIIAFVISMFVALVINILYNIITSATVSKYFDEKIKIEYDRAKRIKKIRMERIVNNIKSNELMDSVELIDYYYGNRDVEVEKDFHKDNLNNKRV